MAVFGKKGEFKKGKKKKKKEKNGHCQFINVEQEMPRTGNLLMAMVYSWKQFL